MDKEFSFSFSFCIISNPFSDEGNNIVYISKKGRDALDKSILHLDDYKHMVEILDYFGYEETGELQFEPINNTNQSLGEVRKFLEDYGLTYSRELEVSVVKNLNSKKENLSQPNSKKYSFKNDVEESKNEEHSFLYVEPDYGEKVTLYFYLFLEFGYDLNDKPVIQLGGGFSDPNNYSDKNYIKVVKSDFKRVKSDEKPDSIVLSSCKTQEDFLRESGILYSGFFRHQKKEEVGGSMVLRNEKIVYNLIDVVEHLSFNQPILVEVNRSGYDYLIGMSKTIKTEGVVESNKKVLVSDIINRASIITSSLTKKMLESSLKDDFETASKIKTSVDFINDKVDEIKKSKRVEITTEDYFKTFYIPLFG